MQKLLILRQIIKLNLIYFLIAIEVFKKKLNLSRLEKKPIVDSFNIKELPPKLQTKHLCLLVEIMLRYYDNIKNSEIKFNESIKIKDLTFSFGQNTVLNNLNLKKIAF